MSNAQDAVQPVSGPAAPNAPAPANVPVVTRRTRRPGQPGPATVRQPAAYTKGQGISTLLQDLDNHDSSMIYNNALSTYIPSFLSLKGAITLATRRLANHDRLLKDTGSTHPYLDEAYLGFCWIYHILRCNRTVMGLLPGFSSFLAELEDHYPPNRMHIPGYAVPFFASVTTLQSPYEWQGNIAPTLPELGNTSGNSLFRYDNGIAAIFPSPVLMIDQVHDLVNNQRSSNTTTPHRAFDRAFGQTVSNSNAARWVTTSVHYALETGNSARGDWSFWQSFARNQSITALTRGNFDYNRLDLPRDYEREDAHTTACNWAMAMGITDYHHVTDRRERYLNWPLQYSSEIAFQCQYIIGSRPLNDISTAGLGAALMVSRYMPNPVSDPSIDPNTTARREARRMTNLIATGRTADVELEQIATQHADLCQVNPSFVGFTQLTDAAIRSGPFWDLPAVRGSPQLDAAAYLYTNLAQMISSTKV